jgi:chemotaxis protein methyltransferase CheR
MAVLSDQELADISSYIKEKYGVNLAAKSTLIEGRLGCYIRGKGFDTYGEYFEFAKNDPSGEEMSNLINRLTTNHTFFMRENNHFEYFAEKVMPWIETLNDGNDLRLWSAGCASGEEPYGLSIYILEYAAKREMSKNSFDTTILASDISVKALTLAQEGMYSHENLNAMPENWLRKYFTELEDGMFRVKPELRKNVAFKRINLLEPYTVRKPFQTIFCRNVMIYFDTETRQALIEKFFDLMIPGGYLFIGHSESLTNFKHGFKYIQPSIYRKPLD